MSKISIDQLMEKARRMAATRNDIPAKSELPAEIRKPQETAFKSLDFLLKDSVFEVTFAGFGRPSEFLEDPDPRVDIHVPGKTGYYGYIVRCRRDYDYGNTIRDGMITGKKASEPHNARIIRVSKTDPRGPYTMIGTLDPLWVPKSNLELPFTLEESLGVLRGANGFSSRYVKEGYQGQHQITAYTHKGQRLFGPLKVIERRNSRFYADSEKQFAESKISGEIYENLKLGDDVLVEFKDSLDLFRDSASNKPTHFIPIINFQPHNMAESPEGLGLMTRVVDSNDGPVAEGSRYERGDIILDLPILLVGGSSWGDVGIGYVQRPKVEDVRFYYKKILVIGAHEFKGRYIPRADILETNPKVIIAQMR
ncbi:hypothetical protein HYS31_03685 [Candidatus Woesearchaeota archaeon]|nr:hypothetical protein [Candidatus Woesearchaeota archaeon]